MPNSPAARKRVRQNERRADRLRPFRTRAARAVRDAREAIANGAPEAAELVRAAQAALDSAARRNIIHSNAASRRKSRLAQQLRRAVTSD
jgi:small subunit ribosomal protein S20